MDRIRILNTQIDNCTMEEAAEEVLRLAHGSRPSYVVTPNLDFLLNMDEDPEFDEACREADLILADGISIVLLAKYLRRPLKEKVSGSDLFPKVCGMAAKDGLSVFLLGAAPGVAEKAAANLMLANPDLKVAGTYSPPIGFEHDEEEIRHIIRVVTEAAPDILFIAISQMKGEKFIHRYRDDLKVPVTLSVGASVDFAAGHKKRAPRWVSRAGLEWLYRTIQEPRRIGSRVLRDICGLIPLIRKYQ